MKFPSFLVAICLVSLTATTATPREPKGPVLTGAKHGFSISSGQEEIKKKELDRIKSQHTLGLGGTGATGGARDAALMTGTAMTGMAYATGATDEVEIKQRKSKGPVLTGAKHGFSISNGQEEIKKKELDRIKSQHTLGLGGTGATGGARDAALMTRMAYATGATDEVEIKATDSVSKKKNLRCRNCAKKKCKLKPCDNHPCDPNAKCVKSGSKAGCGSYSCKCILPYIGNGTECTLSLATGPTGAGYSISGGTGTTGGTGAMVEEPGTETFVAKAYLATSVPAGSVRVPMQDAQKKGFKVGQTVLFGTGRKQETRIIIGFGSIILDRPLTFSHPPGTMIEALALPSLTSIRYNTSKDQLDLDQLLTDIKKEAKLTQGKRHQSWTTRFDELANKLEIAEARDMLDKQKIRENLSGKLNSFFKNYLEKDPEPPHEESAQEVVNLHAKNHEFMDEKASEALKRLQVDAAKLLSGSNIEEIRALRDSANSRLFSSATDTIKTHQRHKHGVAAALENANTDLNIASKLADADMHHALRHMAKENADAVKRTVYDIYLTKVTRPHANIHAGLCRWLQHTEYCNKSICPGLCADHDRKTIASKARCKKDHYKCLEETHQTYDDCVRKRLICDSNLLPMHVISDAVMEAQEAEKV
jgi:hypothetical protein